MPGIELVIFDCDGVLIDSEMISCRCAAEALSHAGIHIDTAGVLDRFLGIGRADMVRWAEGVLGRSLGEGFLADLVHTIRTAFDTELRPIPGVREAVAAMGARRCVASGSDPDYIRDALALTGLLDLFTPHLFSATMVARGKPAPDVFLYAASQMGVAPERCVVIEDSDVGVRAGKAAGMTVFGFTGGSHIGPADQVNRMRAAGSDGLFDAMVRLPDLVKAAQVSRLS